MSNKPAEKKTPAVSILDTRADRRRFAPADTARIVYSYIAPATATVADVQRPGFFTPLAAQLRPWARIEVMREDGAWFAELLVLSATGQAVHTFLLREHTLPGIGAFGHLPPVAEGTSVTYLGAHRQWAVVRDDGSVIKDGFESQHAARQYLETWSRITAPSGDAA